MWVKMSEETKTKTQATGILTVARKKRQIHLYQKIQKDKPLTRAELKELEKIEEPPKQLGIVDTGEQVASAFNVSIRTVERWKKDGMPRLPDGKFSLIDIQNWRSIRENKTKEDITQRWDEEDAKWRAKRRELEYKKALGEYVSLKEVEKGRIARILAVKKRLLSIPKRLTPQLVGLDIREIESLLRDQMNHVIDEFAGKKGIKK